MLNTPTARYSLTYAKEGRPFHRVLEGEPDI